LKTANIGSFYDPEDPKDASIFNNLTLYGSIFAKGNIKLSGNQKSYIDGDVFSGGNVTIDKSGAKITGSLNYAGTLSPESYKEAGGGNQKYPILDSYFLEYLLPKPFPLESYLDPKAKKININNEILTLNPGAYGDTFSNNGGTLRLSNGDYYFNSVTGKMTIDIKNISSGIRIFIAGDFEAQGSGINMTINGSPIDINNPSHREIASLIYIEVQGNISMTSNEKFAGTIYASNPDKDKGYITLKNIPTIIGALYARGEVIQNNTLTIYYIPADENNLPDTWSK